MITSNHTATVLCLSLFLAGSYGDDWPHWLGPKRDGISRETGWSAEGKPDSLWSTNVGLGYSSFAVVGDRLYTTGFVEDGEYDAIHCLDAHTGEEVWVHTYPAEKWAQFHGGGTLTTPTVDGENVYVSNREGRLTCLRAADGEVVWERDQAEELGIEPPTWGFAASPLVLGDEVIMNLGIVIAYDKASGKPRWKTPKSYGHAYSTPAPFEHDGKALLAVFAGDGLAVLDRNGGGELFTQPWKTQYDVNAMTPIVVGERIFVSSGYNHGCCVVELGAKPKVVWESKVMRSHMAGPTYADGHLYGFDESELKCVDLDGKERWGERGLGKGALTVADGKLLVMSSKGELVVAEASPEGFHELSRAKVLDGGVYWTKPVLANGLVYCRNSLGDVVCRDHRRP